MPKTRVEDEIANDGSYATLQTKVKEREAEKLTQYRVPVTFTALRELLETASETPINYREHFPLTEREPEPADGESEQEFFLRLWKSACAAWARSDVYESISGNSTLVTIHRKKMDLMEFPLKNLIKAYNNNMEIAEMRAGAAKTTLDAILESDRGFKAWRNAARKLTEGYLDADGERVAPQAKMVDGALVAL